MKTKQQTVICPECKSKINLDELMTHQVVDSIRHDLESEYQQKQKETKEQLRKQILSETSGQVKELQAELNEKSSQLTEMNNLKAKLEKAKREKGELSSKITLEKEQEFTQRLGEERIAIKEQADEANSLKLKEREKVISDLTNKLDEAKRQAEQGSMQLQGEIQELALEEMLKDLYPLDEITEVKKGQGGADTIQQIRNKRGQDCGKILYESKRTKTYSASWLNKLKGDNLVVKADLMVLVTSVLPKEIERYGVVDGIWVCAYTDVKELSMMLRFALLKLHGATIIQNGKESKMERLYDYLSSQEFAGTFGAIIDGFRELQNSHAGEKLKLQKLWKQREKQLDQILTNSIDFYGSIKGIAGESIPEFKMLEFPKKQS
ncbi:MAG: Caldesmon, partial [Bacteroidetes bacterium]